SPSAREMSSATPRLVPVSLKRVICIDAPVLLPPSTSPDMPSDQRDVPAEYHMIRRSEAMAPFICSRELVVGRPIVRLACTRALFSTSSAVPLAVKAVTPVTVPPVLSNLLVSSHCSPVCTFGPSAPIGGTIATFDAM